MAYYYIAANDHRQQVCSPTANPEELICILNSSYGTDPPNPKPRIRPARKRKMTMCLSKAYTRLRGFIANYMSPAHIGTEFVQNELQKHAVAEMMEADPNPWHEYGRLESDVEDDCHYTDIDDQHRGKKSRRATFKGWLDRIAAKDDAEGLAYVQEPYRG